MEFTCILFIYLILENYILKPSGKDDAVCNTKTQIISVGQPGPLRSRFRQHSYLSHLNKLSGAVIWLCFWTFFGKIGKKNTSLRLNYNFFMRRFVNHLFINRWLTHQNKLYHWAVVYNIVIFQMPNKWEFFDICTIFRPIHNSILQHVLYLNCHDLIFLRLLLEGIKTFSDCVWYKNLEALMTNRSPCFMKKMVMNLSVFREATKHAITCNINLTWHTKYCPCIIFFVYNLT